MANINKNNTMADLVNAVNQGGGGSSSNYSFSNQFTVENSMVFVGNTKSDAALDIKEIFESTDGIYKLTGTANGTIKLTARGSARARWQRPGAYGSEFIAGLIASKKVKLTSYDKDGNLVDNVVIPSMLLGEYIDSEGYMYAFENTPPRLDYIDTSNNCANFTSIAKNPDYDVNILQISQLDVGGFNSGGAVICGTETASDGNQIIWRELTIRPSASESVVAYENFSNYPASDDDCPEFYLSYYVKDSDVNKSTKIYPMSYNDFMNTTRLNVCALKHNANYWRLYVRIDPTITTAGFGVAPVGGQYNLTLFAPIIKKGSVPVKSTTKIDNDLIVKAGGYIKYELMDTPDHLADFNPELNMIHQTYNTLAGAEYVDVKLNNEVVGHEGVMKHSIIPAQSTNIGTGESTKSPRITSSYTPIVGTMGALKSTAGYEINTPELFCYGNVYDELSETAHIRRFSKPVVLKKSWFTDVVPYETTQSQKFALFTYKIPIDELEEKPAYNSTTSVANVLNQGLKMVTETALLAIDPKTEQSMSYRMYMSLTYNSGDTNVMVKFISADPISMIDPTNPDLCKEKIATAMAKNGFTLQYELAEPVYRYDVDKIYVKAKDKISWTTAEDYNSYSAISLKSPLNTEGALDMIEPVTSDINSLNNRVEVMEAAVPTIGVGDGSTDNYSAFMDALTKSTNITVNEGTYVFSQPITIENKHVTIQGNGKVVFVCPSGQPAIVIQANDTTIKGITFYISKTADGVTETDNGWHCGIYVDGTKGLYRTKITDCNFQGAHRYTTLDKEFSYGIYFKGSTQQTVTDDDGNSKIETSYAWAYFNVVENCKFFALRTCIYGDNDVQPCKIDMEFDQGENIYSIPNLGSAELDNAKVINALGCKYGVMLHSPTNFIKFRGQFIGDDTLTPKATFDDAGNVTSFERLFVSDCAVYLTSSHNYVEGFAYDIQRAKYGYVYLGNKSRNNKIYIPYLGYSAYTTDQLTTSKTYKLFKEDDPPGATGGLEYTVTENYRFYVDNGFLNRIDLCEKFKYQNNNIAGSCVDTVDLADGTLIRRPFPDMMGTQDDSLSYLVEAGGSVEVYTKNNGVKNVLTNTTNEFKKVFNPKYNKSRTGVSIVDDSGNVVVPTANNPIYIEIHFPSETNIDKIYLNFNEYIAKNYTIYGLNYAYQKNGNRIPISNNNKGYNEISTFNLGSQMKHEYQYYYWYGVYGIIIEITSPVSVGSYNTTGKVGFSKISIFDSNKGGSTFVKKGGDEIYGALTVPYMLMRASDNSNKLIKITVDSTGTIDTEVMN